MPVLAFVMSPVKAAALLLPIFVVSDLAGLWSYRREFDRRNLSILIPSGIAGIGLGWATASLVTDRMVGLLIGARAKRAAAQSAMTGAVESGTSCSQSPPTQTRVSSAIV